MPITSSPSRLGPRRALLVAGLAVALGAAQPAWAEPPRDQAPTPSTASDARPAASSPDPDAAFVLPESLKAELREEIKRDVLEQARREGWAAPSLVAEWMRRFKLGADVRGRYHRAIFGAGNDNTGAFPDFNAINTGKPFDVSLNPVDTSADRFLNVDQSRTRPRLRARLGVDVDVGQGFTAGLRLGSGESSAPVSNNQTLGASGGMFSKYSFWLDRAYLKFDPRGGALSSIAVLIGRFDNPFFGTDLLWWDDLAFDGAALTARGAVGGGLTPFPLGGTIHGAKR